MNKQTRSTTAKKAAVNPTQSTSKETPNPAKKATANPTQSTSKATPNPAKKAAANTSKETPSPAKKATVNPTQSTSKETPNPAKKATANPTQSTSKATPNPAKKAAANTSKETPSPAKKPAANLTQSWKPSIATTKSVSHRSLDIHFSLSPDKVIHFTVDPNLLTITKEWVRKNLRGKISPDILRIHPDLITLKSANNAITIDKKFPQNGRSIYVVPASYFSLEFVWECDIVATSKNLVNSYFYQSDVKNGFEHILQHLVLDFPPGYILLTEKYLSIDSSDFYRHPRSPYNLVAVDGHHNYSELCMFQVCNYIDFSLPHGRTFQSLAIKAGDSNLNLMIKGANSDVLDTRINLWVETVVQSGRIKEWNELVLATTNRLSQLHQAYTPSHRLLEQARRLIIDQILISVCCFREITFSVEAPMINTTEEVSNGQKIGWGKLDYLLKNFAVKAGLEANDEDLRLESLSLEEVNAPAETEYSTLDLTDIEAKETFDDKGLAQMSAQLFDLLKENRATSVQGLLCTGTFWRFFSLSYTGASSTKPILRFEGEKFLQIIKQPTSKDKRRDSAQNENVVSYDQVMNVMLAVAASI